MLMLYDRDENLLASLKYNNIVRKRELNGLNTLDFETDREVEFGQRVLFMDKEGLWNEYIIIDYFKNHTDAGVEYSVYCEDCTSELYRSFIEDMKPKDETCSSVLMRVLEGTRFEVGRVDDFGLKSFNLYRTSVKSAIWKMIEEYGAEINVRLDVSKNGIEHRYIDLRNRIDRKAGKRYEYSKDIQSIEKTTSVKDLVTALYGFGKGEEVVQDNGEPTGGYGRKLDFSEINGGKKYVADEEARRKYGVGKNREHIFGMVDFPDCEDKNELLRLTQDKLKELSKPKITYELKVEDVSRYEGYEGEGVGIGDTVIVRDKEMDTLVETRVIAITDNPIEEMNDDIIVLGNYIKDLSDNFEYYDKLKSTLENDRSRFNDELDKLANGVKSSYIQSVIDRFNKELNETGGWVYAEPGEGILILNAPKEGNPTQAINLKGGKIAIANHKNPDGSFAYETFGDGDGFTANLIRAGVLRGGKVFFNLEDGTFLMGNSPSDYSMYRDGSTLHMRNVDIDLENNADIQELKDKYGVTDEEIAKAKEEISQAKGDIEKAKGELASAKESLDKDIEKLHQEDKFLSDTISENKESQDRQNEVVDEKILDLSTKIQVTDGKINTEVSSLRESIERIQDEAYDDSELRKYISEHYSTIEQTDSKIETKVSSVKKDVTNDLKSYSDSNLSNAKAYTDSKDSSVRNYIQSNYSTISQTDDKIASEVGSVRSSFNSDISDLSSRISQTANSITSQISSVKKEISSGDQDVMNYISNNYTSRSQTESMISSEVRSQTSGLQSDISDLSSRISQTANEISSKVSKNGIISAINQSAERIKIDADRIELKGTASMEGTFVTIEEGDGHLVMQGDLLGFVDGNYSSAFGAISVVPSVKYNRKGINIMHNDSSFVLISKGSGGSSDPYVVFDAKGNSGLYKGYDYSSYPVFFSKGVKFGNQGVSFWMDNDDAMILKVIKYSDGTYALRLSYLNNWYIEFRNNGDLVSKRYGESAKKLN